MANVTGIGTSLGLNNFAKEGRLRSIIGTNALQNPLFDADNGYPIGEIFNGQTREAQSTWLPAHWSPCSGISPSSSAGTLVNTFFDTNYRPYEDTAKFGGEEEGSAPNRRLVNINYSGGRSLKMYGIGLASEASDRDPDRTYEFYPVTHTTGATRTIDGTTPWGETDCWTKYEWTQGVSIPDGMNTATFGAYVKCDPSDLFRALNFGGIYAFQNTTSLGSFPQNVYSNIIAIKRASTNLNLKSGTIASPQGQYHWSGNSQYLNLDDKYGGRWNDTSNVQSITYKDAEDYPDFIAVEKTITLQSGTGRKMGLGMYFMENHSYLPATAPDPNPLSGSIEFYNPFLIFSS